MTFGETLKKARMEKGLSQQQLAELLYVDRSTITNWEGNRRIPDFAMISKLSKQLGVDINIFLDSVENEKPVVIMLDNEKTILNYGVPLLKKVLRNAEVYGFTKPSMALEFVRTTKVSLVFLDIEMGMISGFDVCKELLNINPKMNVVFLTAYADHALNAWATEASGFILKPLTEAAVKEQIKKLRYPVKGLEK